MYLWMFLHEVQVFECWTLLCQLVLPCPSFVGGAFEVILLVVPETGWQQVVHHHDTNVDTTGLQEE